MSRTLSSRPTTTREMPHAAAKSAPSALVMVICVLPWIASDGAIARISETTPRSCSTHSGGCERGPAGQGCGVAGAVERGAHLYDDGVHPRRCDLAHTLLDFGELLIEDENIQSHVALDAARMDVLHDRRELAQCEIVGTGARVEAILQACTNEMGSHAL